MFGFPFITSLIVVIVGVVVVSVLVNKGLAKRAINKGATLTTTEKSQTQQ